MSDRLKRAAAQRLVRDEMRGGFGGQCRLASAAVTLPALRKLQRMDDRVTSETVAKLHREACEARTRIRRVIRQCVNRTPEQVRGRRIGPTSVYERVLIRTDAYDASNPYSVRYLWEPTR
ncbi:hypothetical protein ACIBUR_09995 [Streptomyces anulatus]